MSEAEKNKRLNYRQNRKKWILAQAIAVFLMISLALSMLIVYRQLNKTYYIDYTERGNADYTVNLKNSEFFPSGSLESGRGYIAELIDSISAAFTYQMLMDTTSMNYEYTQYVDATLRIINKKTGSILYEQTDILSGPKNNTGNRNKLTISENVVFSYEKYDSIAQKFISTYLPNESSITSSLTVSMHVSVTGNCSELENSQQSEYTSSVVVPLREKMVDITTTASSLDDETRVLACKNDVKPFVFRTISIAAAILALILTVVLVIFVRLTRNEDINYEIKVKKLVRSYRSYIQTVTNGFDFDGYQVVMIRTFIEMLGIRDTTQMPVLMSENEDKTCTHFFIPTNTKILYLFEIKVDNYDELYNRTEEVPETESVNVEAESETIIIEDVDGEELERALETPDIDLDEIDYIPDNDVELDEGTEVIGVVWPEKTKQNKIYKYDPNGEQVEEGDIVLVPSKDVHKNKDVIRKAAVAHANHKVAADSISFPLKKIIGVVRRGLKSRLGD